MSFQFTDHTYLEIREKIQKGWHAVLPTGCTEQQGPHLPVDFDTKFAHRVASEAAAACSESYDVNHLVLPPLPFGPTPEHRDYGTGYIDLPHELHEEVIYHSLRSLADQGFSTIVVWRGCGEHRLHDAVARFNREYRERAKAILPELPYQRIWEKHGDPAVVGGHADSFTTSVSLWLWPESVRTNKIYCPDQTPVNWENESLNFRDHSESGVIGDPTHASRDLGAKLWTAIVDEVALMLSSPKQEKRTASPN